MASPDPGVFLANRMSSRVGRWPASHTPCTDSRPRGPPGTRQSGPRFARGSETEASLLVSSPALPGAVFSQQETACLLCDWPGLRAWLSPKPTVPAPVPQLRPSSCNPPAALGLSVSDRSGRGGAGGGAAPRFWLEVVPERKGPPPPGPAHSVLWPVLSVPWPALSIPWLALELRLIPPPIGS